MNERIAADVAGENRAADNDNDQVSWPRQRTWPGDREPSAQDETTRPEKSVEFFTAQMRSLAIGQVCAPGHRCLAFHKA